MESAISAYEHLLPPTYKDDVRQWLRDDCPSTDIGGFVVGEKVETAHLLCKGSCVLAGVPFAQAVFELCELEAEWLTNEGALVDIEGVAGGKVLVAKVTGKCRNILLAERTALNILSRASGVATISRTAKGIADSHGWQGSVAGTRKTTPGFRHVEKYALLVGGVATHRLDLSQMVMLKDNHIWSCGSITAAVKKAKSVAGFSMKVEVECQNLAEAVEAAEAGADIVMLDNQSPERLKEDAARLKQRFPSVLIEASGGILEESMHLYMSEHVDVISRGTLTQGYPCIDFSLKVQKQLVNRL